MSDSTTIKKKIIHAELKSTSAFLTSLTAGKHHFLSDEPENVPGGNDEGPDPYDYLLMSLGSCTLMTVKMYAQHKGWELGNMYIELRHHKTHAIDCEQVENPNSKIDLIEKDLIIEGDFTQEQLDKMLEISKKCPVHRTLMSDIRIESKVERG